MKNWIPEQMDIISKNWSNVIKLYYPKIYPLWSDSQKHLRALKEDWNKYNAVKYLNWKNVINNKSNLIVLDLGAGTGWLSAYLSKFKSISKIYALDSDKKILTEMLPEIVKNMGGIQSKIEPIIGLFSPLLVNDGNYDLIVASSSIHHADNLFQLLQELRRVLKKGGKLLILNETPTIFMKYLLNIIKIILIILYKTIRKKVKEFEQTISASYILYDPYLGDREYTFYHWNKAITQAGFKYEIIETPFFPYKKRRNQKTKLTHFICY